MKCTGAGRFVLGIAGIAILFGLLLFAAPVGAQDSEYTPGTVTATFFSCPAGMTWETLVPENCSVITEGFDASIDTMRGEGPTLTIADAAVDGSSFVWSPVGTFKSGQSNPWAFRETVLPAGATSYAVTGDVGPYVGGDAYFPFDTSFEAPNVVVQVYSFFPADAVPADSTLTIHERACGANNYTGGDPYAECHDYLLDYASEYNVYDIPNTYYYTGVPSESGGDISFSIPGDRVYVTNGISAWPGIASADVYCTDENTGDALPISYAGEGVGSAVVIDFTSGASIVCDWYIVSDDFNGVPIGGEQPTPAPTQTATATATATTTVTSLPNTGSGAAAVSNNAGSGRWVLIPFALVLAGLTIALHAVQLRTR